jgi:hypothetical protein
MNTAASSMRGFAAFFRPAWMNSFFDRKPNVKSAPKPKLSETEYLTHILSLEMPETTNALTVSAWKPIFTGLVDELLETALAGGPEDQMHPASWVHVYHVHTAAPADTVFSGLGKLLHLQLDQSQVALYGTQYKIDLPEGSVGMCMCAGKDNGPVYIQIVKKYYGLLALMGAGDTILKQGDYILVSA